MLKTLHQSQSQRSALSLVSVHDLLFFTHIPCTYTSSPLDGMAKYYYYYYYFYMDTQNHANYHVWIHFIPSSLSPRREKNVWSELESNPGPLASQVTALITRPLLLGPVYDLNN